MGGTEGGLNKNYVDPEEILTPRKIVQELGKYIIGQEEAKKAVAVALRNRIRRRKLPEELKEDVTPKNILMIGPTGVGKTEIARRLANIVKAPFIKIEATRFTEVGYVGKDVQSMIRDLVNVAVDMVKAEKMEKIKSKAENAVAKKIARLLLRQHRNVNPEEIDSAFEGVIEVDPVFIEEVKKGKYDSLKIRITIRRKPQSPFMSIGVGVPFEMEELQGALNDMLSKMFSVGERENREMTVAEAKRVLLSEEIEKRLDMEEIVAEALKRVEEKGIIFIDEIDKIAFRDSGTGPAVSREGVQRDMLPIVEGTVVNTRYGPVRTDHILFIAAGAFHLSKPSDLIPELQGRFPIRVELDALGKDELKRILVEPKNSLVKQYKSLLETEGVNLKFTDDALDRISEIAYDVNQRLENIGARRLYTVMEKLLEDILFDAPEIESKEITITKDYVDEKLKDVFKSEEIAQYIL